MDSLITKPELQRRARLVWASVTHHGVKSKILNNKLQTLSCFSEGWVVHRALRFKWKQSTWVILLSEKKETACDKGQNRAESQLSGWPRAELNHTRKYENNLWTLRAHGWCIHAYLPRLLQRFGDRVYFCFSTKGTAALFFPSSLSCCQPVPRISFLDTLCASYAVLALWLSYKTTLKSCTGGSN